MPNSILLSTPSGDSAEISLHGAELRAWRAGGVDLIWEKDPAVWDETAPILFPVVGRTRGGAARVKGETYPLGLHGFASKMRFAIAKQSDEFLALSLQSDAATRALYPFDFRLTVEFRLFPGGLENALVVENVGAEPMPYACGLHPGFRWPLAGSAAQHSIVFEKEESPEAPIITPNGLFSRQTRPVPLKGRVLPLSPDLFANDALVVLDARSSWLVFDNGAGARIEVALEDFPHIGLWTRPPAPYLCIEPWTGYGDPEDFCGELAEKPSMRILAPGESARHAALFRFQRA